jgi:nitrous oxidase accessory protein NosD
MRPLAFPLLIALFWPLSAEAAVYDVGPPPASFGSIAAAFVSVTADAPGIPATETITVLVNGGSYSGLGVVPLMAQPLVISAVAGTQPLISSGGSFGISISGVANVTLQGLSVKNFTQAGVLLENCPGVRVIDNTLSNNATELWLKNCPGAYVSGNQLFASSSALRMEDSPGSVLRHNRTQPYFSGLYSQGITVTNSAGTLVFHNWVTDANNGLTFIGCDAVTVSANVVVARTGSPVQGITLDSSGGCWVLNNLAVGQLTGIVLHNAASAGLHNNTVWDHVLRGLRATNSPQLSLRNNIFAGDTALFLDAASMASLDSQYNDLDGQTQLAQGGSTAYPDLSAWQGTGNDTLQSISADPLFVDPGGDEASDFALQGGSPVQGRGLDLSALFLTDYFDDIRPSGSAWEQGFHALAGTPPTPTPTCTVSPVVPTPTPSPSATASPSPAFSPTQSAVPSASPTRTQSATITPTFRPTAYPFKRDKLVSYPNPYNPSLGAPLNFVFDPADEAGLRIFDIAGGLIAEIPAAKIQGQAGYASWDGKSDGGERVPVGLYLAVIRSPKGNHFTRFTVVY